ncbi:hypothetical protein Dsin_022157 [Dipteronia sinensis]|uniref:PPIase cyclophilin-type domain-containing protein n=1 Tax=Dipteronia sinensis TaxID=43782 RepID=A0AAE0A1Y1_9ROSI|nr:hypothetical protein Dsin_022157 [Dipteronia sinensis]
MENTGPGINNSQFLICILNTEWLDGNVFFGQVIQGFDVIKVIEKVGSRFHLLSLSWLRARIIMLPIWKIWKW